MPRSESGCVGALVIETVGAVRSTSNETGWLEERGAVGVGHLGLNRVNTIGKAGRGREVGRPARRAGRGDRKSLGQARKRRAVPVKAGACSPG